MKDNNFDIYNLTPELLDQDTLFKILKYRCIRVPHMENLSKDQLIGIFKRVVVPLPQRTRTARGRRKKHVAVEVEADKMKLNGISIGFNNSTFATSIDSEKTTPSILNRLKPPPDAIDHSRKTIKLSQSSSSTANLDNIIIKDRRIKKVNDCSTREVKVKTSVEDRTTNGIILEKRRSRESLTTPSVPVNLSKPILERPRIKLKRSTGMVNSEGQIQTTPEVENKRRKKS